MAEQLELFESNGSASVGSAREVPLGTVLTEYDLVEVHRDPDFIVVAERPTEDAKQLAVGRNIETSSVNLYGLGNPSPGLFTSYLRQEYNSELRGINGLLTYDKMRKSDATVRESLRMYKIPVLSARWFIEPYSNSKRDQKIAEFVWRCLTEYMSISFTQVLYETLIMLEFGYSMLEKVWDFRVIDGELRTIWKKLAPRHPLDVKEWIIDAEGGPRAVVMYPPVELPESDEAVITIDKLAIFTFDKEAGNIEGIPLLRSAYQNWFYKQQLYKIDGIQKERHGIGVPIIKLPVNFTTQDKTLAEDMGRNLRTNEKAHVVLPPNWEILFAKLEGQPVDALASVEHHDRKILDNILAPKSDRPEDQNTFLKSSRFIADIVREVFNLYCIPQLVDFNYSRVQGYPKLRVRRIGETADWRTLSFAVRNLIGSRVLTPDEKLEIALRDEMDLPPMDPDTARVTEAPQAPGATPSSAPGTQPSPPGDPRVGPPRQNPQPVVRPPSANAGTDKSGG